MTKCAVGLLSLAVFAGFAEAKPPKTTPPLTTKSTPAESQLAPTLSPAVLVTQLNQLYESLEYDRVIPFAEACLKRGDLDLAQQLEVYRLLGSARAIVEDPVDAEKPFRLLLRARPEYDLPANTPPKILAVFRKVQSEEKALAGQLREVERQRIISSLKLLDELPAEAKGGQPLQFALRLRDPGSAVETIKVSYRKPGVKAYSSLALQRREQGDWRGAIPADFTATSSGFPLEYYVETADAAGPLLRVGAELSPRTVSVLAGLVETKAFKPVSPTITFLSLGLTAAIGVAAAVLGVLFNLEQGRYRSLRDSEVSGAVLFESARQGGSLATGVNVTVVGVGVGSLITGVLLLLTDFEPAPK